MGRAAGASGRSSVGLAVALAATAALLLIVSAAPEGSAARRLAPVHPTLAARHLVAHAGTARHLPSRPEHRRHGADLGALVAHFDSPRTCDGGPVRRGRNHPGRDVAMSEAVDPALFEPGTGGGDAWPSGEAVRFKPVADERTAVDVPATCGRARWRMSAWQPERSPPPTPSGRVQ